MKTLIDHYIAYDRWANGRFIERLEEEPDAILDREAVSSFPTIRRTLLHIRDAENAWYCRLSGSEMAWPADPSDRIATLLTYSDRFCDHVRAYDEKELMSIRIYHDLRGNEHRQVAWQMIMHCLNHSTQHRGQVITQMRSFGMDRIPANDMVVFQRSLAS